jgi:chloramphenicol-sensitive protein RarD
MAQRIVWCGVTVIAYLARTKQARFWWSVEPRIISTLAISAASIAINWWVYIWVVDQGKIVESSFGYFINPLVNVVFGVVFLRERLNGAQWPAIAFATSDVIHLTLQTGAPLWVTLASTR